MFRQASNKKNYQKRYSRLANTTKKINISGKTARRGGIKL